MAKSKVFRPGRVEAGDFTRPTTAPHPASGTTEGAEAVASPAIRPRAHTLFEVERAAYARRKADLLRDAPGQYVVFVGEEMIGPFPDFRTAHVAGRRHFGLVQILIREITAEEPSTQVGAY